MENIDPDNETVLQQLLGIPKIGDFFTTLLTLVPAFLLALIRNWIYSESSRIGAGFWLLCGFITMLWLLFLENKGRIRITTPLIPIPLKWLVPIITLYLCFSN